MKLKAPKTLPLFHRRWGVPIISSLHKQQGHRFVELERALGASKDSLSSALSHLIEIGLIQRAEGYGHPLRPEYLLTDAGLAVAPDCHRLLEQLRRRTLVDVGLRKWSMPVLYTLGDGPLPFSDAKRALGRITPRALSTSLEQLQEASLVKRYEDLRYGVSASGKPLYKTVHELESRL